MDQRRALPTIGLVVLIALDLVLIMWALWPASTPTATSTPSASRAATASPGSSAGPSGEPGEQADRPAPLTRLVVPVGDRAVWAADVGTCKAPGAVHVSDDLGKTWTTRAAEGSVTRIRPEDATSAFVVGGTARCETRLWTTGDGGESWDGPTSAAASWGRSARNPRQLHRPGGDPVTPCEGRAAVLDLASVGRDDASVVCANGSVRSTTDAGGTWRTALTRKGAAAVALENPTTGVLAALDPACDGVLVGALADGDVAEERCVEDVAPEPGLVAVGVAPSGVWLVVGDAVLRADAAGAEFAPVSEWPAG